MKTKVDVEKGYMAILALVVVIATFYLGQKLISSVVPEANKDIVNVALGTILALSSTVINYYFGSSKSSSDKTDALSSDDIGLGEIANKLEEMKKEIKIKNETNDA